MNVHKRRQILGKLEKRIAQLDKHAQTKEMFTIDRFIGLCLRGEILDDEGTGYWVGCNGEIKPSASVFPSEIVRGQQPPSWATHVAWFNH